MNYYKATLSIFVLLAVSRFIPHPPNFTSLIALSFYVPAFLGIRFLPVVIICFGLTDFIIGFHGTIFFTWGSVLLIGLLSQFFKKNLIVRISGALIGAFVFFIITNFGVWTSGFYGYSISGLVACYVLALPFFSFNLISTFIFSGLIEITYKIFNQKINYFK